MNKPLPATPRWETAALALSFVLLWGWYLARQAARQQPGGHEWWGWQVLLAIAGVVLLTVMVRRMRRIGRSLRENAMGRTSRAPRQPGSHGP